MNADEPRQSARSDEPTSDRRIEGKAPDPSYARVRFRHPVSAAGYVDGGWWPRSVDLTIELPPLLDLLWSAGRNITRVSYVIAAWDQAPHLLTVAGRMVRLGGFTVGDPLMIGMVDAWGGHRIDILVIPPRTDASMAKRALLLASATNGTSQAQAILDLARAWPHNKPALRAGAP